MSKEELLRSLPPTTLRMAECAVRQGVLAQREAQKHYNAEREKADAGQPYNFHRYHAQYNSVRVSAEILWTLFSTYSYRCLKAIEKVAEQKDGFTQLGTEPEYLLAFMEALADEGHSPVRLRTEP